MYPVVFLLILIVASCVIGYALCKSAAPKSNIHKQQDDTEQIKFLKGWRKGQKQ